MARTETQHCLEANGFGCASATRGKDRRFPSVLIQRLQNIYTYAVMAIILMGCNAKLQRTPPSTVGEPTGMTKLSQVVVTRLKDQAIRYKSRTDFRAVENPVHGIVTDASGKPISRARVSLFRRTREWPRHDRERLHSPVWTGADGRFEFGTSRGFHLELEVVADRFATQTLLPSPRVEECVVAMPAGFRIVGCVLDSEGASIHDCSVFLEARSGSRMRARQTKTGPRGRFVFTGIPAELLRLVARHPDYQPATLPRVTAGKHRFHTLEFPDRSGLRVSGTVVNDDQDPLAQGLVRIYPGTLTGLLTVPYEAKTDSDGLFYVAGLAPGSYMMEIRHPEYASITRNLSLKRSSVAGLVMELPYRSMLRGRLTGIEKPTGVKLRVISFFGETSSTTLRADGSFAFPGSGFSLGFATLEIEEGDTCFAKSRSRWHRLHLRDDDKQHVIPTIPASLRAGTVLDSRGRSLAGVRIIALLKRYGSRGLLSQRRQVVAVTDSQGRYRIRGMGPEEVSLGFLTNRFAFRLESTRAGPNLANIAFKQQRTVNLHRPGAIEGRVTRGGRAVVGALVMVDRGVYSIRKVRTDENGCYRIRGLPPGEHSVRVKFGEMPMEHVPAAVLVESGKTVKSVDVELPSRRIKGILLDAAERPMANLLVETPSGVVATTNADGKFELDIPPKTTWLSVRLRQGDPVTHRFPVGVTQKEVEIFLQIAPRARLEAKIVCTPSGLPATGVVVRLEPPPEQDKTPQKSMRDKYIPDILKGAWQTLEKKLSPLDRYKRRAIERWIDLADGQLELSNLPNRTMLLTIRAKGYLPYVGLVELENNSSKQLGVIKLRRGFRVHGQVVDHQGKPLGHARVVLGRESELANTAVKTFYVTDDNGCFMVRGVSLSNRRIYVSADGFATKVWDLKLPRDTLRRRGNPVRIQMQTGATIQVRVEDRYQQPLGYLMVRLHRHGELIARRPTDEFGQVAFTHLGKDDYRVSVQGQATLPTWVSVTNTSGNKVYSRKIVLKD